MSTVDTPLFDCDNHLFEPRDAFTRYLPKGYEHRTVGPVRLPDGGEMILVGSRVAMFQAEHNNYEVATPPGALREMLTKMASGHPEEADRLAEPLRAEYLQRAPRLKVMDEQGVQRAILFPGPAALACMGLMDDVEAFYVNAHSYHRWLDETWGFNYQDRIYTPAMLTLRSLEHAVEELEFVLGLGARFIMIPTGPADGRSPADPYFDPFWSRMQEARASLAFHVDEGWYNPHIAPAWGLDPYPRSWHMSAWQWQHTFGDRPIQESLSALILDNLFGRFPGLRVVASEFGASWTPYFVHAMDKSRWMGRSGPWIGGPLKERPSEIFRRHVRVAPYPEEDPIKIINDLGQLDSIVLGSDWPHSEGLKQPGDYRNKIAELSPTDQRKILWDNAMDLVV